MYGKLLSILNNEKRSLSKTRGTVGPVTLNMAVRRRQVKDINRDNDVLSRRLMDAHCYVPNKGQLETHIDKVDKFRRTASTRKANGLQKLDPLVR